jgi:translation initiation factor IF-3
VRAIGVNGEQLGIISVEQAIRHAEEEGLDLVEVAPDAKPPVCRIMDYGRYKFQQEKRQSEGKRHQATVTVKEIKMRPKTGEHDFQVKSKHIHEFLEKGFKVKVTVMFRGREIVHADLGQKHLDRILEGCLDMCTVDSPPKMEGRTITMLLVPKKG